MRVYCYDRPRVERSWRVLPPGSVSIYNVREHEARYLRCRRRLFGPPSDSASSSATSLYPQSFPFSRLPLELRLDILEFYALPQGPVIYRIGLHEQWYYYDNNRDRMREFWSLRQVNREARQAVLRGRQIVRDLRCLPRGTRGQIVKVLCFPAWDRDLFILLDGMRIDPLVESNIQYFGCPLWCESVGDILGFGTSDPHPDDILHNIIAKLPSLRCFYFIMTTHDGRTEEDEPPRFPDSPEGIQMRARDGNAYGHLSVSPETLKLYFARYADNTEWYPEYVRQINRFENEWQVLMFMTCGRRIGCKVVV
ncbi:hypothetical protein F4803DRAFT_525048 [Xylaria telfairii]|nr:hypothetical protein F4803DRAFT_525048 [Xylaria telfairii]